MRALLRLLRALTVGLVALATGPAVALAAAPAEPISHEGRWFTDRDGKVVILHGAAVVVGAEGFGAPESRTAAEVGFSQADAAFLAEQGFNVVRLGMFFRGFSPEPGVHDEEYLASFRDTHRQLAAAGILTLLDFHQDQLAPAYNGRGFPDWFLLDDGAPNGNQPFPQGYFANPALNRAYDNLWANAGGPGGVGLIDRFVGGWQRVAEVVRDEPMLLGYDIFNEPWPGTEWPSCANPAGCPPGGFDQTALTDFSNAVIDGIREVDPAHMGFYEPNLQFDVGAQTRHGKPTDPNVGMSFHNYCLGAAPGLPQAPDPIGACEQVGERLVFENAEAHSEETGAALIMTEFGDSADPEIHRRMADAADDFMVSWTDWAYMGSTGQIKRDDALPPTADNIDQARLDPVVRAYPRLVAGTPERFSWDEGAARFEFVYSTTGVDGRAFPAGAETEIFVPERHLPDGYRVELTGAEVVGATPADGTFESQVLAIRSCPGSEQVTVFISPDAGSPGHCADGGGGGANGELSPCTLRQRGGPDPDRLRGTAAGDDISGRGGDDQIRGGAGDDCLRGNRGSDTLRGAGGRDLLRGGAGADRLRGGGGEDRLRAGRGRDRIRAGGGADSIRAGGGRDRIRAGAGDDQIDVRGGGVDVVSCGAGNDTVVLGRRDRSRGDCEATRQASSSAPSSAA